jgi:hypothetical protein
MEHETRTAPCLLTAPLVTMTMPVTAMGHDKHAGHSVGMFRDRFWLCTLLTVPILVWSETVQRSRLRAPRSQSPIGSAIFDDRVRLRRAAVPGRHQEVKTGSRA